MSWSSWTPERTSHPTSRPSPRGSERSSGCRRPGSSVPECSIPSRSTREFTMLVAYHRVHALAATNPDDITPQIPRRDRRIESRRAELGDRVLILGHHYQQDDVIRHADLTGDSLKLSRMAAEEAARRGTESIVFCGVHFMAETADILTPSSVSVILPDLSAGCSMADMAQWDDVSDCWAALARDPRRGASRPGHLREQFGRGEGLRRHARRRVLHQFQRGRGLRLGPRRRRCAAGRARPRALPARPAPRSEHRPRPGAADRGRRGRRWGSATPRDRRSGIRGRTDPADDDAYRAAEVVLWAGHCSVHRLFRPEHVAAARAEHPDCTVIVHPECCQEVVDLADRRGKHRVHHRRRSSPAEAGLALVRRHRGASRAPGSRRR